jgi:hypothetical protein
MPIDVYWFLPVVPPDVVAELGGRPYYREGYPYGPERTDPQDPGAFHGDLAVDVLAGLLGNPGDPYRLRALASVKGKIRLIPDTDPASPTGTLVLKPAADVQTALNVALHATEGNFVCNP